MDKYRELESQRSEEAGGAGGATDDETPIKITQGPGLTETGESERTWAMVCHLSAFAFLFVPFGNVVGPLIVWLIKKDESSFVNAHGKAALNFQISLTLFFILGAIIAVVASFTVILPIIILIICLLLLIYGFVMIIVGGVSAYNGNYVEIPLSTRFLK
ncbi:MAG: DUF4870 domain-containing protein [Deltaproteobacteria bacterium]|nr:DUF4870 domain-containing protein [Deltaproteobacteria bacterium]